MPTKQTLIVIYVVVDQLSKYGHFIPLKLDFTNAVVAKIFDTNFRKLHCIPHSMVSDHDKVFYTISFGNIYSKLWVLLWPCLLHINLS